MIAKIRLKLYFIIHSAFIFLYRRMVVSIYWNVKARINSILCFIVIEKVPLDTVG